MFQFAKKNIVDVWEWLHAFLKIEVIALAVSTYIHLEITFVI